MARSSDTYSAAQAAQILGVSERRVRQLVNEGKLAGERGTDGQVHISQQAVNEERKRRRKPAAADGASGDGRGRTARRAAANPAVDVDQLADRVASAVGQRLEGQLEITRKAESLVRDELDQERARRMEAEAKLDAAQTRLAELETALAAANERASERRGLFRRKG